MRLMIKVVCLLVGGCFLAMPGSSQDFGDLILGSTKDANYLSEGYLSPAFKAFGTGLNQGWYNTAKPHRKFGFDLTISVSGVMIPSSDELFTVDNTKLESLELVTDHEGNQIPSNGSGQIPTIFGPPQTQSAFVRKSNGSNIDGAVGFDLKDEIKVGFLPVPVYNIGFGLPKGFELKLRLMPTINIGGDNGEFRFFGIGVLHDVKQHIPGIKMLPFDLSAFAGYTRLSLNAQLDDPTQIGELAVSATTIQGLISKKIGVLTLYGGLGYDFTKSNLKTIGYYDLNGDPNDGPNGSDNEALNPVDLSVSSSGPRATAGLRLKFAFFTLHGDYTLQKYSAFSAGFGFSFR
jgi:hypothetical protein